MAFAVGGKKVAGLIERRVVAEAGECVRQHAVGTFRMERCVAGDEREFEMRCEIDELAVDASVVAEAVAVDFDVDVVMAKEADEILCGGKGGGFVVAEKGFADRSLAVAGEGDEIFEVPGDQ